MVPEPPAAPRFEPDPAWEAATRSLSGFDVAGVAVTPDDTVIAFARAPVPVQIFSRRGERLSAWGEGMFARPHGISLDNDGNLLLTDEGAHLVRRCTLDGRVLTEFGVPGRAAPPMSGLPFNRCTHTACAPNGDIFVSDGYGNARIHRYSADGRHLASWGASGAGRGEFNVPHNLCFDGAGRLVVADRENHRLQAFDLDGRCVAQHGNLHRPCALCACAAEPGILLIGELGPGLALNRTFPNIGFRVAALAPGSDPVTLIGGRAGSGPDAFIAPHGIACDRSGGIYVAEVAHGLWPQVFPDRPKPADLPTLRRFRRISREAKDGADA